MNNHKKVILTEPQQIDIVNQFLRHKNVNIKNRFGVYYLEPGNSFAALPKHVEAIVFRSAFNNCEEMLYDEFLPYNAASHFILVIDHDKKLPVGMMRVIDDSLRDTKTLKALTSPPWSHEIDKIITINHLEKLNKVSDISTLAILPEYRSASGFCIGLSLYLAINRFGQINNIEYYLALLDDKAFRVLKKIGFPVAQLEGTTKCPYLGSECTIPAYINRVAFDESISNNHQYVKKIKFLSMIASKYIAYENTINPNVDDWLISYEKYTYPLAKLIPAACLNLLYKKKKHT